MKAFSRPTYRVFTWPVYVRFLYSAFLSLVAVGLVTNILFDLANTHYSFQGALDYYRGNEATLHFRKTPRELLETFHFHIYSLPVVWLILAHVMILTSWPERASGVVILAGLLGIILNLAAPWLVTYVGGPLAVLFFLGGILLTGAFAVMIAVPLFEMWVRPKARAKAYAHRQKRSQKESQ